MRMSLYRPSILEIPLRCLFQLRTNSFYHCHRITSKCFCHGQIVQKNLKSLAVIQNSLIAPRLKLLDFRFLWFLKSVNLFKRLRSVHKNQITIFKKQLMFLKKKKKKKKKVLDQYVKERAYMSVCRLSVCLFVQVCMTRSGTFPWEKVIFSENYSFKNVSRFSDLLYHEKKLAKIIAALFKVTMSFKF